MSKMSEQLLDNPKPVPPELDPDVEVNAAGGAAAIPQVSINRSTVAELERRRLLNNDAVNLLSTIVAALFALFLYWSRHGDFRLP